MKQRRGSIVFGVLLVLLGLWYLAVQLYPPIQEIAYGHFTWPFQIIGLGALFALLGLVAWAPGLFIPACIIAGIGGILYWQNLTGNWESWSYAWTLIPGFVGVGLILLGIFKGRRGPIIGGLWNLFAALVLFGIFGYALGHLPIAGIVWPLAIVLFGLFLLVSAFTRRRAV